MFDDFDDDTENGEEHDNKSNFVGMIVTGAILFAFVTFNKKIHDFIQYLRYQ
ncbi:hypothetical protein FHS18_000566 [Paenibacillus phyllosphaerae]|uniref:Uncharacterized protein n=1 Tax=Paenibacillus phyllosphaerae TaxID=274593 RepID=A0A7W5FKY6_9BACL|nr:hypothetical protein [Paenibacillus phyllosphaerae]